VAQQVHLIDAVGARGHHGGNRPSTGL